MGKRASFMNQRMQNNQIQSDQGQFLLTRMKGLSVFHGFLSQSESQALMHLIDKAFVRLAPSYFQGHFDNVMMGGYREAMVSSWGSESLPMQIFQRLKNKAGLSNDLKWENIHVLDLKDQNV